MFGWWGLFDTADDWSEEEESKREKSLYEKLFLNKSVENPGAEIFQLNDAKTELRDTTAKISNHIEQIAGALESNIADLKRLLAERAVPDQLSLINLSHLYRIVSLSRALKLKVKDFWAVKSCISIDPFESPDKTLVFIRKLRKIQKSKFSIPELDYVLRHHYEVSNGIAPTEEGMRRLMGDIRSGLFKIEAETADQDDPDGEMVKNRLQLLLEPAAAAEFKTRFFDSQTSDKIELLEDFFSGLKAKVNISFDKETKKLKFSGVMTPAEKKVLDIYSNKADFQKCIQKFYDFHRTEVNEKLANFPDLAQEIIDFFDKPETKAPLTKEDAFNGMLLILNKHLRRVLGNKLVCQLLASSLNLDVDLTRLIIEKLLQSRIDPQSAIIKDFLALVANGFSSPKDHPEHFQCLLHAAYSDDHWISVSPGVVISLNGKAIATPQALKSGSITIFGWNLVKNLLNLLHFAGGPIIFQNKKYPPAGWFRPIFTKHSGRHTNYCTKLDC